MANQNGFGPGGQGGFLRIMGIIYLIKLARQRRRERRARADAAAADPGGRPAGQPDGQQPTGRSGRR